MFTGRLRAEIPPALVMCFSHHFPLLPATHSLQKNHFVCRISARPVFGHVSNLPARVCTAVTELTGRRRDAGGRSADRSRPQRQRVWTRWRKGHREAAQELRLLHSAGAATQQLRHGRRRREGQAGDGKAFSAFLIRGRC